MAGVGKKILGLFVEMEETPEAQKKAPNSTDAASAPRPAVKTAERTVPPPIPAAPAMPPPLPTGGMGAVDEIIAKSLADALEKANLSGFDYFEYARMLDALKATIPAEQALYQTAFTSGTVMGATRQFLLESANHYLSVLDKEGRKFEGTVQTKINESVKGREEQLASIDESIRSKAEQIAKLTGEINILNTQKSTLNNELTENRIKIEKVKNDFAATLQTFCSRIQNDIKKIESYIA